MTNENSKVIEITNPEQLNTILKENNNVMIDFFAEWCGPCKQLSPVLDSISEEFGGVICKINVDDNNDIAQENGIRSIPTVVYFKNGTKVKQTQGFLPKNQLLKQMSEVF
jgi:thioredoxin 1